MLPLLIPLIVLNGVNATIALVLVGLFYIGAGVYYKIPVPVQPLKAAAAIAIVGGFSATLIAASGLIIGALMLCLGVTGLIDRVTRVFSKPVIRGIQATLGILLLIKGIQFITGSKLFIHGSSFVAAPLNPLIGLIGVLILALLLTNTKFPATIALLVFGFTVGISLGFPDISFGPQLSAPQFPTFAEFPAALLLLVVPQIPLTISNAVVSTSDLAKEYFKRGGSRATPRSLATSMGLANLGAGALGGIPMCHGSGGLAAHHRFGARTGGANLMVGGIFIALALVFGPTAANVLGAIPLSILGVLLVATGLQMMRLLADLEGRSSALVVLSIAGMSLAVNMALGFMVGIVLFHSMRWRDGKEN
jgi:SulP family sulfate permease